jgi:hypothetical protein
VPYSRWSRDKWYKILHSGHFLAAKLVIQKLKFILSQNVPNLNCISIMMSFLTYITGFFMNFELLPIFTDYAN